MVFFEVVKLGFSGMVNLFEGLLSVDLLVVLVGLVDLVLALVVEVMEFLVLF